MRNILSYIVSWPLVLSYVPSSPLGADCHPIDFFVSHLNGLGDYQMGNGRTEVPWSYAGSLRPS